MNLKSCLNSIELLFLFRNMNPAPRLVYQLDFRVVTICKYFMLSI